MAQVLLMTCLLYTPLITRCKHLMNFDVLAHFIQEQSDIFETPSTRHMAVVNINNWQMDWLQRCWEMFWGLTSLNKWGCKISHTACWGGFVWCVIRPHIGSKIWSNTISWWLSVNIGTRGMREFSGGSRWGSNSLGRSYSGVYAYCIFSNWKRR